jgi:hypothetical protein
MTPQRLCDSCYAGLEGPSLARAAAAVAGAAHGRTTGSGGGGGAAAGLVRWCKDPAMFVSDVAGTLHQLNKNRVGTHTCFVLCSTRCGCLACLWSRARLRLFMVTRACAAQRPWHEFFERLSLPRSGDEVAKRVNANFFYYQANYAMIYAAAVVWAW